MLNLNGIAMIDEIAIQERTEYQHGEARMAVPLLYICVPPPANFCSSVRFWASRQSLNATS